jgi:hypothetical protein
MIVNEIRGTWALGAPEIRRPSPEGFVVPDGGKLSRLAAFVENPADGWTLGERWLDPGLYDRDERG